MKVTHFQKSRCTCNNTLTFRSSELIANVSDYNPKPHIKNEHPLKKNSIQLAKIQSTVVNSPGVIFA